LYVAYGVRLVLFMLRRESSKAYCSSKHGSELNDRMTKTKLPVKGTICVFVSLSQLGTMYALQPLAKAPPAFPLPTFAGLGLGFVGLVLESVADEQKQSAKGKNPDKPVMIGLYRMLRHPNYLGEIIFWAGILGAAQVALPTSASIYDRLKSAVGPAYLIFVMLGAAKRLDTKAVEKYSDDAEYKAYAAVTPSLWPPWSNL